MPVASRAATERRASGEKRHSDADRRRAVGWVEAARGGGQREQDQGEAADPDAHREHVHDIGGEEHDRRVADARVARERRREDQESEQHGERGEHDEPRAAR
jgi:hypothetical protein